MNIDAINATVTPKNSTPSEEIQRAKEQQKKAPEELASSDNKSIQPEELLGQIKALTEDGLYSVRFENDETQQLIVKIVDNKTDEVIRQIPPEELMQLTQHLNELRGNMVDTIS